MSIWGVCGGAGTGKTTRLLLRLEERLAEHPLEPERRVLALVRYHGARFRLIDKLNKSAARGRFDCFTFDRFAWQLCSRWRGRLRDLDLLLPGDNAYDETCSVAAALLAEGDVARWVAAQYPIVLVDEFQDCREGRLEIVQRLAGVAGVAVGADEFQDLSSTGPNPAVAWLRSSTKVEELTVVHRTRELGLLAAATAIRSGGAINEGPGFRLIARPTAPTAASFITQTLTGFRGRQVAVIAPTGPDRSRFVRSVLDLVCTVQYGRPPKGPFTIEWEGSSAQVVSSYEQLHGIADLPDGEAVGTEQLLGAGGHLLDRAMGEWVERQRRLRGLTRFPMREVRVAVRAAAQRSRATPHYPRPRTAMTAHQAKNREFPVVFVLWPFEVAKGAEKQRRLLYNAVTRAREKAYMIVQGKGRLREPPFSA